MTKKRKPAVIIDDLINALEERAMRELEISIPGDTDLVQVNNWPPTLCLELVEEAREMVALLPF
jgi:hypothetical protein